MSHGVSGFIEAIEKAKTRLTDVSVADRVVGKAIALLCVYAKVKAVYAETVSKPAMDVLESNAIFLEHDMLVERVLSADKSKMCPFEQLMEETVNPIDAYLKLKSVCYSPSQVDVVRMKAHE